MRIDGDDVIFSTGKKKYANNGIIGLSPNGSVSEGYDGGFWNKELDDRDYWSEDETLTKPEKIELAEYMIKEWSRFLTNAHS